LHDVAAPHPDAAIVAVAPKEVSMSVNGMGDEHRFGREMEPKPHRTVRQRRRVLQFSALGWLVAAGAVACSPTDQEIGAGSAIYMKVGGAIVEGLGLPVDYGAAR
jgi:hypothetical protein